MTKAVNIKETDVFIKDDEYEKLCYVLKEFNIPFEEIDDWSVKNYKVFYYKNI